MIFFAWVAKFFRLLLVLAGVVVLAHAARKGKPWEAWDAKRLGKVGSGEAANERMVSLGRFFETPTGAEVVGDSGRTVVLGRRDLSLHEKNFSFPIYINWFLVPEGRGVDLVFAPEEAAGYRWLFAWQDSRWKLEKAGLGVEEVWGEGKLFVYRIETRLEEIGPKNLGGGEVGP